MDAYEKRVTTRGAQCEIREMMLMIRDILVEEEPWLAKYIVRPEAK